MHNTTGDPPSCKLHPQANIDTIDNNTAAICTYARMCEDIFRPL